MTEPPVPQSGPSERQRPEGQDAWHDPEGAANDGPLSTRFAPAAHGDAMRMLRRTEPPPRSDSPLPPGAAAEPSEHSRTPRPSEPPDPLPRRMSEPPRSFAPFSMHMFDGPLSAGPLSDAALMGGPLSMRIARVSGEAGPGYRITPGSRAVLLEVEGSDAISYQVARLSPAAIWFLAEDHGKYERGAELTVHLSGQEDRIGPLRATVVSIERAEDSAGMLVGIHVKSVPLEHGRRILGLLRALVDLGLAEPARSLSMTQEYIEDAERIRSIIIAFIARGGEGILRGQDIPVAAVHIDGKGGGGILWKSSEPWGAPPYLIDMVGYCSIQRLHITSSEVLGADVRTPLPTKIERVRHRWFRRCDVKGDVTIRYSHPLWPELGVVKRKVRDISFAGIGFETVPEEDLGFPGLELPEIFVDAEGFDPIRLKGQVRFVSARKPTGLCGMRITPSSPDDELRWRSLIGREMHGTTEAGMERAAPLWALFEQSGYFHLSGKTPAQFEQIKQSFFSLGRRVEAAPALFCQIVWPSGRGVEASGSVLKAYDGTWLTHQLAKRSGKAPGNIDPRQILRDIYVRAFEHPQADPDFRWAIAYLDAKVAWSKRAHLEFADRYRDLGLSLVMPFRLREGTSADKTCDSPEEWHIDRATYEETEQFLEGMVRTHPMAYRESLDLVPDRFGLELLTRSWKAVGIERERELLIAHKGDRMVAAALLETGETGSNLFRLLDAVRLFPLVDGGESAFLALLDAARDWYGSRSKSTFTVLDEHPEGTISEKARLRDLGDGHFWAISSLLVPELLEHIYELTAPRVR